MSTKKWRKYTKRRDMWRVRDANSTTEWSSNERQNYKIRNELRKDCSLCFLGKRKCLSHLIKLNESNIFIFIPHYPCSTGFTCPMCFISENVALGFTLSMVDILVIFELLILQLLFEIFVHENILEVLVWSHEFIEYLFCFLLLVELELGFIIVLSHLLLSFFKLFTYFGF